MEDIQTVIKSSLWFSFSKRKENKEKKPSCSFSPFTLWDHSNSPDKRCTLAVQHGRRLTFHSVCWKLQQMYFGPVSYFLDAGRSTSADTSMSQSRKRKNTMDCVECVCVCVYSSLKQTMWYIPEGHTKKRLCLVMDWSNSPQKCCNSLLCAAMLSVPKHFFVLFCFHKPLSSKKKNHRRLSLINMWLQEI